MSATDELRRLLDERGMEHYDGVESTLWLKDDHGYRASADELTSGRMSVHIWCETPEQAVEATLGRGTCRRRPHINLTVGDNFLTKSGWDCSECGCRLNLPVIARYCPNCGRKVVSE